MICIDIQIKYKYLCGGLWVVGLWWRTFLDQLGDPDPDPPPPGSVLWGTHQPGRLRVQGPQSQPPMLWHRSVAYDPHHQDGF